MLRRWVFGCAYLMFTFVHVLDGHLAGVERAKTSMLSFDIKKKVKHHNRSNGGQNIPLKPPDTKEELEFILRVILNCLYLFIESNRAEQLVFMVAFSITKNTVLVLCSYILQSTSYAYVIELDLGSPPQKVKGYHQAMV